MSDYKTDDKYQVRNQVPQIGSHNVCVAFMTTQQRLFFLSILCSLTIPEWKETTNLPTLNFKGWLMSFSRTVMGLVGQ